MVKGIITERFRIKIELHDYGELEVRCELLDFAANSWKCEFSKNISLTAICMVVSDLFSLEEPVEIDTVEFNFCNNDIVVGKSKFKNINGTTILLDIAGQIRG